MNTHNATLINGTFNPQDAASVVLEMLSFKIRYHQLRLHSHQERFGEDTEHAQNRIKELTKERKDLIQWLETIGPNQLLDIQCQINIRVSSGQEKALNDMSVFSEQ